MVDWGILFRSKRKHYKCGECGSVRLREDKIPKYRMGYEGEYQRYYCRNCRQYVWILVNRHKKRRKKQIPVECGGEVEVRKVKWK